MMKRLPTLIALALPATAALIGLCERSARADVIPVCVSPGGEPECSDGFDNVFDGRIDTADPGCVSAADWAEGLGGYQPPPCQRIDIVLWEQFLRPWPWPPVCPECGLTIIDWRDILTTPIDELIQEVHPDWEVSIAMKLTQPIQGVFDDPKIPNLRLRFRGNQPIGPGALGAIVKFGDPTPTPVLQYVGRAWSARTGKLVVNVGALGPQQ